MKVRTGRGSVTGISIVLINGKGFTGNRGLIDLEVCVFSDDATISGDLSEKAKLVQCSHRGKEGVSYNSSFLDLEDITRDDFWGFNFLQFSVT
jgi:hypothetical protein